MKTSVRQRAQRKRRTDWGIVGQATTDETIDRARSSVLCYNTLVLASSGAGTVSVWLATFRPMPCRFFSGRSWGALHHQHRATLAATFASIGCYE
jgi:hypothetical protein